MVDQFDLVVVGGGTGGLRVAFKAALEGRKTALVEPAELGGTCLNRGCIPTKAMLHAAHVYTTCARAKEFGIEVSRPRVNFAKLMDRVHGIVSVGREHIEQSVRRKNLKIFTEKARFIGVRKLAVGGRTITGKKIVISTGSRPRIPVITGLDTVGYLTSNDVLHLKKLPRSVGIIGGGYIAMELATFFNLLGVSVIVIGRAPRILPAIDSEISETVMELYRGRGVHIETDAEAYEIKKKFSGKEIRFEKKGGAVSKVTVDEVVLAVGRVPNTGDLDLGRAGVACRRGAIRVNDSLATTAKNVFALGDVTGKAMFAHAAKRASDVILENTKGRISAKMPFSLVPWAVFTSPPISGVGMSERELAQKKVAYEVLTAHFSSAGRTEIIGETAGLSKIYYERKSKRILGATMFGAHADELIHEFAALLVRRGTVEDLQKIIHVHPTVSEVNGTFSWPS